MNARQVIMCGGPAHGRWIIMEPGVTDWYCVEPPGRINLREPVPEQETVRRVRYNVRPIMLFGHTLHVGVAVDEAYDDRAVMQALLQRDVATHLGAYR